MIRVLSMIFVPYTGVIRSVSYHLKILNGVPVYSSSDVTIMCL